MYRVSSVKFQVSIVECPVVAGVKYHRYNPIPGFKMNEKASINVHPMLYYTKQSLGMESKNSKPPMQVTYPTGNCAIALPLATSRTSSNAPNDQPGRPLAGRVAITSYPENSATSRSLRANLRIVFLWLAGLNFLISVFLYAYSDSFDESKQNEPVNINTMPKTFDIIQRERNLSEKTVFSFSIIFLALGVYSVHMFWPLGIKLYSLAVVIMLIVSMPDAPYFMYCYRYLLDIAMLYVAQKLQSHLVLNFLSVLNSS